MPWYVTAYVTALIALAGMSWQMSNRLGWPAMLRNGDVLSTLASIILTTAYWHEHWRLALGGLVVPIFMAQLIWLIYAIKPAIEIGMRFESTLPERTEAVHRFGVGVACVVALAVSAPALFWGWRVTRVALDL